MTSPKTTARDLILGLFFFGIVIGLVWITTQLRNWPGVGSRNYLPVLFEDINGVKKEDRVLVYGNNWGRVAKVDPISTTVWRDAKIDVESQLGITGKAKETFEPHVLVTLELDYPLDLREGYIVYAEDANLLGGKVVTILPGDPNAAIRPREEGALNIDPNKPEDLKAIKFYGKRHPHPITAIGEFVDSNQADFRDIVKRVKSAIETGTDPKKSPLGMLLADSAARDKIDGVLTDVSAFTKNLNKENSLVHDLVADNTPLRKNVNDAVANFKSFSDSANDPDTLIGGLVTKNSKLKSDFDKILGDISGATDKLKRNDSFVGRMFAEGDDTLGSKAKALVDDFASLAHEANHNEKSLIFQAFKGDLGDSVREGVTSFKNIATKIETKVIDPVANSTGVLGWLINDPNAKKKMDRLLSATLGIIEDAREAAPVTSLGSFIFGGF